MIDALTNFGLRDPWKNLIDKYSTANSRIRPTVMEVVQEIARAENGQLQLKTLSERIEKVADWQNLSNLSFLHDLSQLSVPTCSLEPIAEDAIRLNRLLQLLLAEASGLFAEQVLARFTRVSYPTKICLHVPEDRLEIVEQILEKFPCLITLNLGCVEREVLWYTTLKKCRHLTRLELAGTPFSSSWYAQVELPETVEELVLYNIAIDDRGLQNMLKSARKLFHLSLGSCSRLTCKKVLFPQTLRHFVAQDMPLCDEGFVNLAASCYALEDLRMVNCLSLSHAAFERATLTPDIAKLYLAAIPMSQQGFKKLLTHCDHLKVAHLWDCRGVTSFVDCRFPASITEMSFTSFSIDYLSLQHAIDCCPKLSNLIVEECKEIELAKVSFPTTLKVLGLARVTLTDKDAERIVSSCRQLERIFFTCCEGLSQEKANQLCEQVAKPSAIERFTSSIFKPKRQG